jgi:putative phosphoesterase
LLAPTSISSTPSSDLQSARRAGRALVDRWRGGAVGAVVGVGRLASADHYADVHLATGGLRMRVAIVSDIHGNLTALEAVIADISRRGVDRVVHGGDLALIGCQPAEVIDRVRELGWSGIVGNTDELLWRPEQHEAQLRNAPKLQSLLRLLFDEYAPATRKLLGEERVAWLRQLPSEHREQGLLIIHASPGDLWRAPSPDADNETLAETYGRCGASTVVYAHIHRPYVRQLDQLTIANSGSVGSPFDGDPRASYLLLESGRPEVVRVQYDVEREIDVLGRSDHPDQDRIVDMRRRGRFVAVAN